MTRLVSPPFLSSAAFFAIALLAAHPAKALAPAPYGCPSAGNAAACSAPSHSASASPAVVIPASSAQAIRASNSAPADTDGAAYSAVAAEFKAARASRSSVQEKRAIADAIAFAQSAKTPTATPQARRLAQSALGLAFSNDAGPLIRDSALDPDRLLAAVSLQVVAGQALSAADPDADAGVADALTFYAGYSMAEAAAPGGAMDPSHALFAQRLASLLSAMADLKLNKNGASNAPGAAAAENQIQRMALLVKLDTLVCAPPSPASSCQSDSKKRLAAFSHGYGLEKSAASRDAFNQLFQQWARTSSVGSPAIQDMRSRVGLLMQADQKARQSGSAPQQLAVLRDMRAFAQSALSAQPATPGASLAPMMASTSEATAAGNNAAAFASVYRGAAQGVLAQAFSLANGPVNLEPELIAERRLDAQLLAQLAQTAFDKREPTASVGLFEAAAYFADPQSARFDGAQLFSLLSLARKIDQAQLPGADLPDPLFSNVLWMTQESARACSSATQCSPVAKKILTVFAQSSGIERKPEMGPRLQDLARAWGERVGAGAGTAGPGAPAQQDEQDELNTAPE